jgi:hypothetical protein
MKTATLDLGPWWRLEKVLWLTPSFRRWDNDVSIQLLEGLVGPKAKIFFPVSLEYVPDRFPNYDLEVSLYG